MLFRPSHFVFAVLLTGSAVGLCPVRASDEADAVTAKLIKARDEYAAELQKFNKVATDALDKREAAARKSGDRTALNEVKAQRKAFEDGTSPALVSATTVTQMRAAVAKFDKAHTVAIQEFAKLKEDAAAATVEREQKQLVVESAFLFGKRTFIVALKHSDLKVESNWFSSNGTILDYKIKKDNEFVPHSIFLHPSNKFSAHIRYPLDGKYLVFRADVGVPTVEDTKQGPAGALTFEVVGDGKSLWKSNPVTKLDAFQRCELNVVKVKVLTLLVHCENVFWARAVWFEPVLIE